MPPLEHFNWNFCCWCVNSCRTEKGRSIMLALRRPPGVKWQQLLWQNTPLMLLFIYDSIPLPIPAPAQAYVCMVAVAQQNEREWDGERERESVMAYWDCWSGEMTNKDIFIDSMQDSHTPMRTRTHTHTLTWTLRVTYSRLLWFLFSSCRHKSIIHLKMTHFLPCGFWQFCGASSGELFLINADFTRKQK